MDSSISLLRVPNPLNGETWHGQTLRIGTVHGKKGSSKTTIGLCTAQRDFPVFRDVTAKKLLARRRPLEQLIPPFGSNLQDQLVDCHLLTYASKSI